MALTDLLRDVGTISARAGRATARGIGHVAEYMWDNENIRYTLGAAAVGAAVYFGVDYFSASSFAEGSSAAKLTELASIPGAVGIATLLQRRIPNPTLRDLVGIGKWALAAYGLAHGLVETETFNKLEYSKWALNNLNPIDGLTPVKLGIEYLSGITGAILGLVYGRSSSSSRAHPQNPGSPTHNPTVTWTNP